MEEANALQVAMAELKVELKNMSHDVKGLTMKLDAMPNYREHAALEKRVDQMEANQRKAAWSIIGAWLGGIGTVLTLIFKGTGHT